MADTIFQAKAELTSGLTTRCDARDFTIILDEPADLGGNDKGMNPVECLLSALGACKCIVARAFAEKNGIKLNTIRIELDGILDPNGFLGKDKNAKIGFSKITTKYFIDADNSVEEVEQYVKFIESNCPVKDTIANTPAFGTELTLE